MSKIKFKNKEDKFKRIVERRVNNVAKELRKVGKCSDTNHFSYTPEEVDKIFKYISGVLRKQKKLYKDRLSYIENTKPFNYGK